MKRRCFEVSDAVPARPSARRSGTAFGSDGRVDCVQIAGEGRSRQFGLRFVFGGQRYDDILIPLGGLHKKRAVRQRGLWATAHHLLCDRGKPQKIWF